MIYLNQKHDTTKKYLKHDEVLMPLVVFLNNRIDYQGKKEIIKEYGFKETEREVKEMCDYANYLERKARNEGINRGKKRERKEKNIEHVRNVMNELNCSYQRATNILKFQRMKKRVLKSIFNLND